MQHDHRRLIVLRGTRAETLEQAARLTAALSAVETLSGSRLAPARQLLGRSLDALVLDLHEGLAADVLGIGHGLVRGGGALLLCLPPPGQPVPALDLGVYPFVASDVGQRFWQRLERWLSRLDTSPPDVPLAPPAPISAGSPEQARVVEQLAEAFAAREPRSLALLAERGRGKSSALGLALAAAMDRAPLHAWVTAPSESAAAELLRFAPARGERLRFVPPEALLSEPGSPDVVVVDEAAQLPVPLLRALAQRLPAATLAFATTTQGYEGTGRGFVLRFLDWLERDARPSTRLTLRAPIRWGAGDPLERSVFELLALAAAPSPLEPGDDAALPPARRISPEELASDEALLQSLLGLLIHAHYRTTPGDLQRLLDAPNLALFAIADGPRVLGATLVAREGGLPLADCLALARGAWRIRGHALADTLVVHAGRPDAGQLVMLRSVRIATHPGLRRRGIARALIEHVHGAFAPDLFGTIFGATPELLEFRRRLGYALVRVGSARGASSGEPSAVLLRAGSPRGQALIDALRADLARNLPLQLSLLRADGELDPELGPALGAELPAASELSPAQIEERVAFFAQGAQTMEAALYALVHFLTAHPERLGRLAARERVLCEQRILQRQPWARAASAAGFDDVPHAMRALRPAVRAMLAG